MGNKRMVVNLIMQVLSVAVTIGIGFLLTPFISRELGKEVYGFIGFAYQLTSYVTIITVAFNAMLNVFIADCHHRGKTEKAKQFYATICIADAALAVLLAIPMLFVIYRLDTIFDVPSQSVNDIRLLWFLVFANFLFSLAFGPFSAGQFIENRVDLSSLRTMESNILKALVTVLLFVCFKPQVWYVGAAAFLSGAFINAWNYYYNRKLAPALRVTPKYFRFSLIRELLAVGVWNTLGNITAMFMNGLDLMVSNLFLNALNMGYISYAQSMPTNLAMFTSAVKASFLPHLTKTHAKGDKTRFVEEVRQCMIICGFLCSVPLLLFMVYGADFYRLWIDALTEEEIIIVYRLSVLILLPSILEVYTSPLGNSNSIHKKIKIPALVALGIGIMNIILELVLLQVTALGVYAIEIATALLLVLNSLVFRPVYTAHVIGVKKTTFYPTMLRGICASGVSIVLFGTMHRFMRIEGWPHLFAALAVSSVLGYMVNYFIVLKKNEREKVKEMIVRRLPGRKAAIRA